MPILLFVSCGRTRCAAGRVRSRHCRFVVQDLQLLGFKVPNLLSNLVGGAVNLSLVATDVSLQRLFQRIKYHLYLARMCQWQAQFAPSSRQATPESRSQRELSESGSFAISTNLVSYCRNCWSNRCGKALGKLGGMDFCPSAFGGSLASEQQPQAQDQPHQVLYFVFMRFSLESNRLVLLLERRWVNFG
jgi:hypothetical protein